MGDLRSIEAAIKRLDKRVAAIEDRLSPMLPPGWGGHDPLLEEARRIVIKGNKASVSFLQHKLAIGYARSAMLLDELQQAGVVGPYSGLNKSRKILLKEYD